MTIGVARHASIDNVHANVNTCVCTTNSAYHDFPIQGTVLPVLPDSGSYRDSFIPSQRYRIR